MAETLELQAFDDNGNKHSDVVLTLNGTPVASTMDADSDSVEVSPVMRMGIGPAQLPNGEYAQAWIRVADGQTFNLIAWGCRDSDYASPDGIELTLMDADTEVAKAAGVEWNEPQDPIASIDGPADVFVQVLNNTGNDLTSDSSAQNWAAGNFDYEVV